MIAFGRLHSRLLRSMTKGKRRVRRLNRSQMLGRLVSVVPGFHFQILVLIGYRITIFGAFRLSDMRTVGATRRVPMTGMVNVGRIGGVSSVLNMGRMSGVNRSFGWITMVR